MAKYSILFLFSIFCSSCSFLASPIGEQLVVGIAEEAIKIEQELSKTSSHTP